MYQHGETRTIDCDNCHCIDGNVNCTKSECSTVPLTCPIEQQINDTETCCQICKGEDFIHKTKNIENPVKPIIVGKHRVSTTPYLSRNYESSSDLDQPRNIGR